MASRARALGVVIVGGNGFLGSHLARSLRKRARVVVTYAKHRVPLEGVLSLPIDVKDVAGIRKILRAQRPDVVVYLGGPEDPAWVEANPKLAEKIFSSGISEVLHAAEMNSARFLYVSNASIFDGTRGNYLESDSISPTTLIGKLKASGEALVRGRSNHASILRLSSLVGSAHPWRPSLFDRLRNALEFGTEIELRDDEYHSWTSVSSAVSTIEAMIDRAPKNALYHYGGLTRLTPLEMGRFFAETLGYDKEKIAMSLIAKKRVLQKGMIVLPEGEKFDYSLNSSAIIRALGVKTSPIDADLKKAFLIE
jgi:dTDP-4-dehydrorhamnose reductase